MTKHKQPTERRGLRGEKRAFRGANRKLVSRLGDCDSIGSVEGYGKSEMRASTQRMREGSL